MAQFDLDEDALVAAAADRIARQLVGDAGFVQRLANAVVGGLLSMQQLRDAYDAGVHKAIAAKIADAARMVEQLVDSGSLRRAVSKAEMEAEQRLRNAAQEIVGAAKIRMQRTLRQAVAELLKDRVDEMVARLMEPKEKSL